MPDIAMCDSVTCPSRSTCYRNAASGTTPSPLRQSYGLDFDHNVDPRTGECPYYAPIRKRTGAPGNGVR